MITQFFDRSESDTILDDDCIDFTDTHLDDCDLGDIAFAYASRGDLAQANVN